MNDRSEVERLRARVRELEQAERRARELAEEAAVGIYRSTPDGRILFANRALLELLGFDSLEALTHRDLEANGFQDDYPRERFRAEIEANGVVRGLEAGWLCADGTKVWLSESARAVRDGAGEVLFYEGTVEEITDRKLAELRLRESEQKYRELIEALPHGVAIVQSQRIVFANSATVEMLGFAHLDDLLEGPATIGLPDDEAARVVPMLSEALERDGPWPLHYFADGQRRDGSRFPTEVHVSRIEYGAHRALQVLIFDITDRQRAAQERQQLMTQLHQADKMTTVGQLAAGIAHEINNPLAFVVPSVQYLAENLVDVAKFIDLYARQASSEELAAAWAETQPARRLEEIDTTLQESLDGLERIAATTRELRQFSHVDDRRSEMVQLHGCLESCLLIAANELKYRATVRRELGDVPEVVANRGKLNQVFLNIIINAAHAIPVGQPESHWIRIRTARQEDGVMVEIANNGPPIPEADLPKIFDPFFTTKPRGVGTGLGLAISYNIIVQQHRGRLEVFSDAAQGTRFRIWLPVGVPWDEPVTAPSVAPSLDAQERALRILVVDDEPAILRGMPRWLAPHEVVTAESGEAALRLLGQDSRFDVVLCDLVMPGLNGAALFAEIDARWPALGERVLFMSGGAFTPVTARFVEELDRPLLEKPLDRGALRAAIEQLLTDLG